MPHYRRSSTPIPEELTLTYAGGSINNNIATESYPSDEKYVPISSFVAYERDPRTPCHHVPRHARMYQSRFLALLSFSYASIT